MSLRQVLSQVRCRVVMVIPTLDKEQAMTPNYLQFQPGLSLNEFLQDYGTQALCEAALEEARWPGGGIHMRKGDAEAGMNCCIPLK